MNCIRILTEKTYPEPIIRGQRLPIKIKKERIIRSVSRRKPNFHFVIYLVLFHHFSSPLGAGGTGRLPLRERPGQWGAQPLVFQPVQGSGVRHWALIYEKEILPR